MDPQTSPTKNPSLTLNLSMEAFSSIIEMAGYGISYWASAMSSVKSDVQWEGLPGHFYDRRIRQAVSRHSRNVGAGCGRSGIEREAESLLYECDSGSRLHWRDFHGRQRHS